MRKLIILPAVLSDNEDELKKQIEKVSPLSKNLHLDYADGIFVDNKTVDWQFILDLPEHYHNKNIYLHLMCQEPIAIAKEALLKGFQEVSIHIETLKENDIEAIKELKELGKIGLALKLETPISKVAPYLDIADSITIMTVEAGGQSRAFQREGLEKIKSLRVQGYKGIIVADGGMNENTIADVVEAGANRLVVGSALTQAQDPKKVYNRLLELI